VEEKAVGWWAPGAWMGIRHGCTKLVCLFSLHGDDMASDWRGAALRWPRDCPSFALSVAWWICALTPPIDVFPGVRKCAIIR